MRESKTLKILSYITLPILIGIILLSGFYIGIKNSDYFNEEKYFNSENFVSSYMGRLAHVVGRLIYNNPSYKNIKDGDMQIFYASNGEFDYKDPKMYFLVIYNKKALTNVELTSEVNTIESIMNYIANDKNSRKFNIIKGEIQADTEILKKKSEQYLENFTNTYYTRDNKTEKDLASMEYSVEDNEIQLAQSSIEYITANIEDYEIYTSYYEVFSEDSKQVMANCFIKYMEPYEGQLYAAIPVCSMLAILIIVYLIVSIGHEKDKEGISTNDFDRIPLEIIAIIALCIGCIPFVILSEISLSNMELAESLFITAYITIYILVAITFDTILKRLKSKTFWRTTLLGKFVNWIKRQLDKIKELDRKLRSSSKYFSNLGIRVIVFSILPTLVFIVSGIIFESWSISIMLVCIAMLFIIFQMTNIVVNIGRLEKKLKQMYEGNNQDKLNEKEFLPEFKNIVTYVNDVSNGFESSIQEKIKSERLKAELITNVSHDIKTPLTSIINYVDLLKQEDIQNEKANEYIGILDNKSQRLKKLIADLVEASKVSTGNVTLDLEKINIVELIKQAVGEFEDKFEKRGLEILIDCKVNEINIMADSRYMYRIIENLFSNVSKYALDNSRVYIDIIRVQDKVYIEMKNISKDKLNISAEELMQRFVRGDKSRNTEGSGLGISIAQNLAELQNGEFNLKLDGDLFKVELVFDVV